MPEPVGSRGPRTGGPQASDHQGLVHLYLGDGKGKTTAALGLGLRAAGQGFRVFMVQFLKGSPTGELTALARWEPEFHIVRSPDPIPFPWEMDDQQRAAARQVQDSLLAQAETALLAGTWGLVVLDEVLGAVEDGLVDSARVLDLVLRRPPHVELVLTGRKAPDDLIALADYVSEIRALKHPYTRGIAARRGIEW